IELLFVLSLLSLLASLLFPVFLSIRGQARQISCTSNLKQIGLSLMLYTQDNEGLYPYAVDPIDRAGSASWYSFPEFRAAVPRLQYVHEVLQPYTAPSAIWHCPADTGFVRGDFSNVTLNALPTSYEKFGTSYYYRTEIAARHASEASIEFPAEINMLFDPVGHWHGTLFPLAPRYNTLFVDGHVKSLTREQIDTAWRSPIVDSVGFL
ncbi:MAG: hypothetical protein JWN98_628, partial [Abditibacteriota bacterium]|nr:hypothetical protein [Abditibacteriota bacterium]